MQTERKAWWLLYRAVRDMQRDDGSFTYRPGQGSSTATASMTVAGIAVLQVCVPFLDQTDKAKSRHDKAVDKAWSWLAERQDVIGDRRTERSFYFLYGLERAAILSDVEKVGTTDWYAAGADLLCDQQKKGGGFAGRRELRPKAAASSKGHPVDTAFAVLFLRRKFQKVIGPTTGPRRPASALLPTDANEAAWRRAAVTDASRGDGIVPALLQLLEDEALARRKAAILAIHAITGESFGLHPYRTAEQNASALAAAARWLDDRKTAQR